MRQRRPRLTFDHVQVAVADLDIAAADFATKWGLAALPGGHHPGRGTANMIVPLGRDYLELIAVINRAEARTYPTSMRVARTVDGGGTFAVWAARTPDLDSTRIAFIEAGFELPAPAAGRRRRPDGRELNWVSQELVYDAAPSPLPFLIEWRVPSKLYPGAAPSMHRSAVRGIAWLTVSHPDPDHGRRLLGALGDDLDIRVEAGPPGVAEVGLYTTGAPLVLR